MRKLGIAIAVICGLYSGLWYYQASQLQKALQESLDQYEGTKTFGLRITHEGIQKGGFPSSITLAVVNPKIKVLGELPYPAEIAMEGSLINGFNLLGCFESVQINGKTHIHVPVIDKDPVSDGLINGNIAVRFVQDRAIVGRQIYDVTVDARGVTMQVESQEVYEDLPQNIMQALSKQIEGLAGKTDLLLAVRLELPDADTIEHTIERIKDAPFTFLTQPIPSVSFVVKEFSQTNNFGSTTGTGEITISEDAAADVQFHMASDMDFRVLKAYHDALIFALNNLVKEPSPFQEFLAQHKSTLENLIPNFQELGTVHFAKDLQISCNKKNYDIKILLPKFELLCDLYGIKAHANGQRVNDEISGELTIDLINYRNLIDSFIQWFNQIGVLSENSVGQISDATKAKIFAYLQYITGVSTDTIQVTFHYSDAEGPRIGHIPWEMFVAKTNELVAAIQEDVLPPKDHPSNDKQEMPDQDSVEHPPQFNQ